MTDVEGMAAVLAEHRLIGVKCRCGFSARLDYYRYEHHVAEQLAAAGYGSKAEAWEKGIVAAVEATFRELNTGEAIAPVNPYRAAEMEGK